MNTTKLGMRFGQRPWNELGAARGSVAAATVSMTAPSRTDHLEESPIMHKRAKLQDAGPLYAVTIVGAADGVGVAR